ncbi:MAG: HAMP domain-containing histidine kinase [Oscillospiraceae bacterium]|nr:HAMP domain-containing histidine kinase [Oscillospiraceae bacterium]
MHQQSVDTIMPVLSFLQRSAFCIRDNGTVTETDAARTLAPACAAALPQWLGSSKPLFDTWDKTGSLRFTITLQDQQYQVAAQPLLDGMLFLLETCAVVGAASDAMSVVSQIMRQPLSELSSLFHMMSDSIEEAQYAAAQRQICLMTRTVSNLTELSRLSQDAPKLHITAGDTLSLLDGFLDEVEDLCRSAGRDLIRLLPKKTVCFHGDEALLKRAILNLISNALKFGTPGTPIRFRAESLGTHLMFQVENACPDSDNEFLRNAFNRLSTRGLLPDVKWGVGLGIPLVNAVARLHGGSIALDNSGGKVTVSFSISLRTTMPGTTLGSLVTDYTGGIRQTLLELSDALPNEVYMR